LRLSTSKPTAADARGVPTLSVPTTVTATNIAINVEWNGLRRRVYKGEGWVLLFW